MVVSAKERGAFFTPEAIADFLVSWAVQSKDDLVLDPGMGDGVFVLPAFQRLTKLGASPRKAAEQIWGFDIDHESVASSQKRIQKAGGVDPSHFHKMSFFDVVPAASPAVLEFGRMVAPSVDAVVGNPPYIRYHSFRGEARESGLARARAAGVDLPRLTSSWAPFLVHAIRFVKPRGRIAMVLPAEILSVDYAKSVRTFLLEQLGSIQIFTFEERVFPGVLEEVVLLLGEKDGGARYLEIKRLATYPVPELGLQVRRIGIEQAHGGKWTRYLLPEELDSTWTRVSSHPNCVRLGDVVRVDIGVVTGRNDYFLLSREEAEQYRIPENRLHPIVSTSRQLRGARFTPADFGELKSSGQKCLLLRLNSERDADEVRGYLDEGVRRRIPESYKCGGRVPWFRVPSVYVPDLFMSYMSSQFPRIAANEAGATSTNTVHRLRARTDVAVSTGVLAASFYNSLSLLSAELEGRSYGGGVLKHETKEAEAVIVPNAGRISKGDAASLLKRTDENLRRGRVEEMLDSNDEILLEGVLGLKTREARLLREGWNSLRARRATRMRRPKTQKS